MKRPLTMFLAIVAATYASACLALFAYQGSLIYYPQARTVITAQSTLVLPSEGEELIVSVRPHVGPNAIIYFGGNAEDVSLNLPVFDKAFPQHALYLLHYRGYGGSSGTPTEVSNHRDAQSLFEKVHAQHPNVVVIGRSLGTGVAVRLASEQPVSRLVLITPYDSLAEIAAAQIPYFPINWLLRDKYNSGLYAPTVTAPTRIIAAEHDEVIPRSSTEKLFARFPKGVASMKVIPATDHNTISNTREFLPELQAAL